MDLGEEGTALVVGKLVDIPAYMWAIIACICF